MNVYPYKPLEAHQVDGEWYIPDADQWFSVAAEFEAAWYPAERLDTLLDHVARVSRLDISRSSLAAFEEALDDMRAAFRAFREQVTA